jgi:hypothetical protein
MIFEDAILTNGGAALLARATAQHRLVWTRVVSTDTDLESYDLEEMGALTELPTEGITGEISAVSALFSQCVVTTTLHNSVTSTVYAVGIWAKIEGDESDTLVAVARAQSGTAVTLTASASKPCRIFLDFTLAVTTAEAISITVGGTGFAPSSALEVTNGAVASMGAREVFRVPDGHGRVARQYSSILHAVVHAQDWDMVGVDAGEMWVQNVPVSDWSVQGIPAGYALSTMHDAAATVIDHYMLAAAEFVHTANPADTRWGWVVIDLRALLDGEYKATALVQPEEPNIEMHGLLRQRAEGAIEHFLVWQTLDGGQGWQFSLNALRLPDGEPMVLSFGGSSAFVPWQDGLIATELGFVFREFDAFSNYNFYEVVGIDESGAIQSEPIDPIGGVATITHGFLWGTAKVFIGTNGWAEERIFVKLNGAGQEWKDWRFGLPQGVWLTGWVASANRVFAVGDNFNVRGVYELRRTTGDAADFYLTLTQLGGTSTSNWMTGCVDCAGVGFIDSMGGCVLAIADDGEKPCGYLTTETHNGYGCDGPAIVTQPVEGVQTVFIAAQKVFGDYSRMRKQFGKLKAML